MQIRTGGEVATDQIQHAASLLQSNFESLTQLALTTTGQLQDINIELAKSQTDVGLTGDHTRTRVEAVRRELGIYAQDLMMMVSQASGQMDAAAQGFAKRAEAMREVANENAGQIGTLGHIVREEINQLANTVQQATEQQGTHLSHAVQQLRTQAEQLMQAAVQSMQNLEQQGTRSMQRVTALHGSVDHIGKQLDRNFEVLQAKGQSIQQSTEILGAQVEKSSAIMGNQSQAIQATAERVATAIAEAGKKLASQIDNFDASGIAMRDRIEALANNVAQQAGTLQRATEQAEETANKLSESEIRLRRDAFMNAAKYLIESLNSLTIDLTRVLDPVEAERVWKEFNKGDASAFTRRFLQMRDEVSAGRLRNKFETDHEFRTYVQRYFRQFEELYEQAQRNDHHDMLATTITTSDVGKMYTYLAGAFGHARLRSAKAA
jgi:methyl-accepting chemotaxis protein